MQRTSSLGKATYTLTALHPAPQLIHYANLQTATSNVHVYYGTPSVYTDAKLASVRLPTRTDDMMPYIDGYHVAYEITNKLGPKSPHIIIMTSRDTTREKGIALMSGAHEVIQKPFEMAHLHERVAAALEPKT